MVMVDTEDMVDMVDMADMVDMVDTADSVPTDMALDVLPSLEALALPSTAKPTSYLSTN